MKNRHEINVPANELSQLKLQTICVQLRVIGCLFDRGLINVEMYWEFDLFVGLKTIYSSISR